MRTSVEQLDTFKHLPGMKVYEAVTAQTGVARMRITEKPYDNKVLRQAIQACVDADRMLQIAYRGLGAPGEDHHVSPVHPEYAQLPKQKQEYALAKRLMVDAGLFRWHRSQDRLRRQARPGSRTPSRRWPRW